ncbi:MAG: polysaccharide biosynthesis protein [Butyribacter sp.]|nr:polysaccharide biosynthesis protein [bacterium]MDY3853444.1 polysaccharide biosynthesis protein [Butyribacter sp.]
METSDKKTAGSFLKQGSILALASILVRIIGMVYRIPMANIIGDEGNGIYSAAFEIYNILLIISSYGMPMAVSKMVSAKCAKKQYKNAYFIMRCSMVFSIISGGAAALFVYFGADWLETRFFSKYHGIAIPLRILAPTIFIVAVMGVFRGLFQGRNTMMPTAISQIFEQIVNAFVSVAAAYMLMRAHSASSKVSAWGAAGGTLGTCFGALTALVILFMIYLMYRPIMQKQMRRDRVSEKESLAVTYRLIFSTVVPIILSQTVYQLSGIVDVTLFNMAMGKKGFSDTAVSSLLGIYSTKYRVLVSVPIAVSTAIASSMVPGLVASYMQKNIEDTHYKVGLSVKFNMMIAFPSAMGLAVLSTPIIRLLFPGSDYVIGGTMLLTGSSCVIFYALSTVTSGVLQSIDRMNLPVYHSLVSLIIHIGLVYGLLIWTDLGAYALVIGNVTYPLLVCILNAKSVKKYLGFRQEVTKTFCIPLLSSCVMGVVTYLVYEVFFALSHRIYIALIPAILAAVIVYFCLILKLKGLNRQELYDFPMGRRMAMLAEKLRLIDRE